MIATKAVQDAIDKAEREGRVNEPRKNPEAGTVPAAKGGVGKKPTKTKSVAAEGGGWSLTLRPACRVFSEANIYGHWSAKAGRVKKQRAAIQEAWSQSPWFGCRDSWRSFLPITVTMVHIGPRMDSDNLAISFKACRDEIASLIGMDDGDPRIEWKYQQLPGSKPGCVITIEKA